MRPLRVHFFAQFCLPAGTYFRYHNLAIGLARLGHEVTVFAADAHRRQARTEVRDGVPYRITPEWRGARVFGGCHPGTTLARALARYPAADVAHLFQPFPSGTAGWRVASRGAAVRCFDWDDLWVGGFLEGSPATPRALWTRITVGTLERHLPGAADHVTTCSAFLASRARERGARGTTVIPNGFWSQSRPARREARAELGLDAAAPTFGLMGYAREGEWCVAGLAAALTRHPRLRLALCGPPLGALAALGPELRDRITHLGALPPTAMPAFVAAIDMGLLPLADTPYNQSRFPIKFAEYLGGGTPVLLSEVGECAQVARAMPWVLSAGTGRSAWIAAFTDAADRLAAAALPAVDHAVMARTLGWDVAASELANVYHALLAAARHRSVPRG